MGGWSGHRTSAGILWLEMSSVVDSPFSLVRSLQTLLLSAIDTQDISYFDLQNCSALDDALTHALYYVLQSVAQSTTRLSSSLLPRLNLITGGTRAVLDILYVQALGATVIEHLSGLVRLPAPRFVSPLKAPVGSSPPPSDPSSLLSSPSIAVPLHPALSRRQRFLTCCVLIISHLIIPILSARADRVIAQAAVQEAREMNNPDAAVDPAPAAATSTPSRTARPSSTSPRTSASSSRRTPRSAPTIIERLTTSLGMSPLSLARGWQAAVTAGQVASLAATLLFIARLTPSPFVAHLVIGQTLRRGTAKDAAAATPLGAAVSRATQSAMLLAMVVYKIVDFLTLRRQRPRENAPPPVPPGGVVGSSGVVAAGGVEGGRTLTKESGCDNAGGGGSAMVANPIANETAGGEDIDGSAWGGRGKCRVCWQTPQNAVAIRRSGVVGCYRCLKGRTKCPVTGEPIEAAALIRLRMTVG